jgi:hypothetical protein
LISLIELQNNTVFYFIYTDFDITNRSPELRKKKQKRKVTTSLFSMQETGEHISAPSGKVFSNKD